MPSVVFSGAAGLDRNGGSPADASAWTWYFFVKYTSFGVQYLQGCGCFSNGGGSYCGFDNGETTNAEVSLLIGTNVGGFDTAEIIVGSDPAWHFGCLVYSGTGTVYDAYWRKMGNATLSHQALDVSTVIEQQRRTIGDVFGSNAAMKCRSYCVINAALSAADVLAVSQSLAMPVGYGTVSTFQALNSHTTAGTNAGTGGNFTINGTLSTAADEPDAALPSGAVATTRSTALAFAANF